MQLRAIFAISFGCFTLALAKHSLADVAPPDDYVEQCTVEKKQTTSTECLQCADIHESYDNAGRCIVLLSPYCYTNVCSAWGGVSYPQVWCRTKGAAAPVVPNDILNQLSGTGAACPSPQDAGSSLSDAATCVPYAPPTTSTATSTSTATGAPNNTSSGCSIARTTSPSRKIGSALVGLLGLSVLVLRRNSGKCR